MTLRNILHHFEFSNKTLDLKCVTLSIISTWGSCVEMKRIRHLRISHNTPRLLQSSPAPPPQTKILRNLWFFFYLSSLFWVLQLFQEKQKTMHVQNFGGKQDALYLRRREISDHPLCPRVFPFSNMAVTGRAENLYYYVAR